ncbi:hypothetical protein NMG60_11009864 [Bertholletia excelsa]
MAFSKFFFTLTVLVMALASLTAEELLVQPKQDSASSSSRFIGENEPSLRGTSRFLVESPRSKMTCDKYPRICAAKGSPGPDCCRKKCVDVMEDRMNCGRCGKKCKYWEICCEGECVNPSINKKHCGSCNNKCKRGSSCAYGICNYA